MAIGDLDATEKAALVTAVAARITGTVLGREGAASTVQTDIAAAALDYIIDIAPRTPDNIGREACIRFAAWMYGSRSHVMESTIKDPSGTELTLRYHGTATANGFRASGASGLVSRFVRRRAGAIAGPEDT